MSSSNLTSSHVILWRKLLGVPVSYGARIARVYPHPEHRKYITPFKDAPPSHSLSHPSISTTLMDRIIEKLVTTYFTSLPGIVSSDALKATQCGLSLREIHTEEGSTICCDSIRLFLELLVHRSSRAKNPDLRHHISDAANRPFFSFLDRRAPPLTNPHHYIKCL